MEDAVVFPQEAAQNNLRYLKKAIRALKRKTPDARQLLKLYMRLIIMPMLSSFQNRSMSGLQIMFLTRIQTVFSGDGDVLYIMRISMIGGTING